MAILGTRGIPAQYGGFETFAEQLSVRLVRRGFEVTVYAEAEPAQLTARLYQGVNVQPMAVPPWGPASVIAYDALCLWHARRQFDLVYMLGYGAAFLCWIPRLYGTPVWINVDGLEWARSKWHWVARGYLRLMEWAASRAASRIIADAQAIAERYRRLYPRGAPCSFLAYGAPVLSEPGARPLLQPLEVEPNRYFLVVARLEPENHVLDILQGHQIYQEQGGQLPLLVVGDHRRPTAYCERLRAAAGPGVRFMGPIYDAALLQALRGSALAYLHGHSVGGTNPSLLESMGCGSVVVAHDNVFNREVLGDCADYFVCPMALAQALQHIAQLAPEALAQRRFAAQQIVSERYTWEGIADQYEQLIRSSTAHA